MNCVPTGTQYKNKRQKQNSRRNEAVNGIVQKQKTQTEIKGQTPALPRSPLSQSWGERGL